jgi:hypothetical protein
MKHKLESIYVIDNDELFDYLLELLASIDQKELNRVFQVWVERAQKISHEMINNFYVSDFPRISL